VKIKIHIPMKVQPKQSVRVGKWMYPEKKVVANAKSLVVFLQKYLPDKPLAGPLRMTVTYKYPWRKSEPKKNRNKDKPKDTSPDYGNISKQLDDVMESMGYFPNDAQLADVHIKKFWSDKPGVWIELEQLK